MEARAPAQTGWEALLDFQAHALVERQLLGTAEEHLLWSHGLLVSSLTLGKRSKLPCRTVSISNPKF